LAYYEGDKTGDTPDKRAFYAWCNTGCSVGSNWRKARIPMVEGFAEEGLSMVLDAQDRPWLAGESDNTGGSENGIALVWCSDACESSNGNWDGRLLETRAQLEELLPLPRESGCAYSAWSYLGKNPSLKLDPSGQPRLAYDAIHLQAGSCYAHPDLMLVRVAAVSRN
jgi:hypothetical protein